VRIHGENPFVPPPEERDPARRLRGRLVSGVTVVTAGPDRKRAGATVSSLLVIEGAPARLMFVLGETADLLEAIEESGRFVVHVLEGKHRELSDRFALLAPSPGGLFARLEIEDGTWGPELTVAPDRARCSLEEVRPVGYHLVVTGGIDQVTLGEPDDPLVWFRGRYRRLGGTV
jgi:3-hydroxy-9,10-secoandrosta-1,3,5(10)-triene-9,17-dione monooxygenase reductase component